jgi:hypothetical protein
MTQFVQHLLGPGSRCAHTKDKGLTLYQRAFSNCREFIGIGALQGSAQAAGRAAFVGSEKTCSFSGISGMRIRSRTVPRITVNGANRSFGLRRNPGNRNLVDFENISRDAKNTQIKGLADSGRMCDKLDDKYSLRTSLPEVAGSDVSHMAIDSEYDWAISVCFASELIVLWDQLSL